MSRNTGSTSNSNGLLDKTSSNQYHHYQLNESQSTILKIICTGPGIRYRELGRRTGFVNGVLTYHLTILERLGYVNKFRHNSITRYYPVNIEIQDLKIISHLRVQLEREIIMFLLNHDSCSFREIVDHAERAQSTISWHLKRLCGDGIVSVYYGEYHIYRINNKNLVNQILYKYKESFTDRVVNNLIEISDEL